MASKGLQGTSHFRNSTASMKQEEPIYLNLFSAQLIGLPSNLPSNANNTLIIEGVKKIDGLDVEQIGTPVEQFYKGMPRSYAKSLPDKKNMDIKMTLEVNLNEDNEAYVYNFFREWSNLIWHPLTGEMKLKRDYTCESMMISVYNRIGVVHRRIVAHKVFLSAPLTQPQLNYEAPDALYRLDVSLRADYWDDVSRGLIEL